MSPIALCWTIKLHLVNNNCSVFINKKLYYGWSEICNLYKINQCCKKTKTIKAGVERIEIMGFGDYVIPKAKVKRYLVSLFTLRFYVLFSLDF